MSGYVHKFSLFSRNARIYLVFLFCYSASFGMFLVALGLYLISAGYDESMVGSVELAAMLTGAIVCVPAGALVDRFGPKRVMIAAGLMIALGRIGLIGTASENLILMAAALFGGGMAIHWIASDVLLAASSTPIERPLLFSSRFATFNFAIVVGSILGGLLPAFFGLLLGTDAQGSQAYGITLTVATAICFLGILPLSFLSLPRPMRREQPSVKSARPSRGSPARLMVKVALPQALASVSMAAIFPFLSIFFCYRLNATTEEAGLVMAGAAIMSTTLALLSYKLIERLGKVRTTALLQAASFPFLLLTGYTPVLGVAVLGFWLARSLAASSYPIMSTYVMENVEPEQRGRMSAVMNLSWNGGWAISAWLSGTVMSEGNYSASYLISAIALCLATTTWYAFLRRTEPEGSRIPA